VSVQVAHFEAMRAILRRRVIELTHRRRCGGFCLVNVLPAASVKRNTGFEREPEAARFDAKP